MDVEYDPDVRGSCTNGTDGWRDGVTAGSTSAVLLGVHTDIGNDCVLFQPDVTELAQWLAVMQPYYAILGMWYGDRAGMRDGVSGNWEHEERRGDRVVVKLWI